MPKKREFLNAVTGAWILLDDALFEFDANFDGLVGALSGLSVMVHMSSGGN